MSWYPKITLEQYKRAIECKRIREETPTLGDLEDEWGLTRNTLSGTIRKGIKRYDRVLAFERAAKMKEDALQRSRNKEAKAQGVLKEVVRDQQKTRSQAWQSTQKGVP
jgi:lambda repressor-like predicted transcriptional regulator